MSESVPPVETIRPGEDGGESTGDPRVDAALGRLADLGTLPTAEHVEVYEDVHRRLQEALGDVGGD